MTSEHGLVMAVSVLSLCCIVYRVTSLHTAQSVVQSGLYFKQTNTSLRRDQICKQVMYVMESSRVNDVIDDVREQKR